MYDSNCKCFCDALFLSYELLKYQSSHGHDVNSKEPLYTVHIWLSAIWLTANLYIDTQFWPLNKKIIETLLLADVAY